MLVGNDRDRENRLVRIVVLDPQSTEPTWGMLSDAVVADVWTESLAHVESGEISVREMLDYDAMNIAEINPIVEGPF